jgi:hypothetical protein
VKFGGDLNIKNNKDKTPPDCATKLDRKRLLNRVISPTSSFGSATSFPEMLRRSTRQQFYEDPTKAVTNSPRVTKEDVDLDISQNNPLSDIGSNDRTQSIYLSYQEEEKGADNFKTLNSEKLREFFSQRETPIMRKDSK